MGMPKPASKHSWEYGLFMVSISLSSKNEILVYTSIMHYVDITTYTASSLTHLTVINKCPDIDSHQGGVIIAAIIVFTKL